MTYRLLVDKHFFPSQISSAPFQIVKDYTAVLDSNNNRGKRVQKNHVRCFDGNV